MQKDILLPENIDQLLEVTETVKNSINRYVKGKYGKLNNIVYMTSLMSLMAQLVDDEYPDNPKGRKEGYKQLRKFLDENVKIIKYPIK